MFIGLELLSAFEVGSFWEYVDLGAAWLRFAARYGIAFLFSLLATGIVIALLLARRFV